MTLDALRAGITLTAISVAAADIAAFGDEAQAIVADAYAPALGCRDGCCYCCSKPGVLVTLPEFLRILAQVQAQDREGSGEVAARARRYREQLGGRSFDAPTDQAIPCPLLVEGRCSVYELRPLVCRGYNSTDADACRRAHADSREGVPIFAPLKDVTDGASIGVAEALSAVGFDDAMVDLGTALDLACAGGWTAVALAQDPSPLVAARNATWAKELWAMVQGVARELGVPS